MTTAHGFTLQCAARRGGRVAEGAPLLREYRLIPYRGFESLSLRHTNKGPLGSLFMRRRRVWLAPNPIPGAKVQRGWRI